MNLAGQPRVACRVDRRAPHRLHPDRHGGSRFEQSHCVGYEFGRGVIAAVRPIPAFKAGPPGERPGLADIDSPQISGGPARAGRAREARARANCVSDSFGCRISFRLHNAPPSGRYVSNTQRSYREFTVSCRRNALKSSQLRATFKAWRLQTQVPGSAGSRRPRASRPRCWRARVLPMRTG